MLIPLKDECDLPFKELNSFTWFVYYFDKNQEGDGYEWGFAGVGIGWNANEMRLYEYSFSTEPEIKTIAEFFNESDLADETLAVNTKVAELLGAKELLSDYIKRYNDYIESERLLEIRRNEQWAEKQRIYNEDLKLLNEELTDAERSDIIITRELFHSKILKSENRNTGFRFCSKYRPSSIKAYRKLVNKCSHKNGLIDDKVVQ